MLLLSGLIVFSAGWSVLPGFSDNYAVQAPVEQSIIQDTTDTNDVCRKMKIYADSLTSLSGQTVFIASKILMKRTASDGREHAITFGRDALAVVSASPIVDGDTTNGSVNSGWTGSFADIHNHQSDQPPSAGDLYNLIKMGQKHPGYCTRFVLTRSDDLYALYLYDLKLAGSFITRYPPEQLPGYSPRFPEPIFDQVDKVAIYFQVQGVEKQVARERALAFILERYDSGVAVLKQGKDGVFRVLQTKELMLKGKPGYAVSVCK